MRFSYHMKPAHSGQPWAMITAARTAPNTMFATAHTGAEMKLAARAMCGNIP